MLVLASVLALLLLPLAHGAEDGDSPADQGLEALLNYDYSGAYSLLGRALEQTDSADPRWPEIAYGYALAAWHKSPPDLDRIEKARATLERIAEQLEGREVAAAALLDIGRIHEVADNREDEPRPQEAESYYRRVMEEYPETEMSQRAALYLAQIKAQSMEEADLRAAVRILETAARPEIHPGWASVLAFYRGHLRYYYLDQPVQALSDFEEARRMGFANAATSDRKLWQIAVMAEAQGETEIARANLQRLIAEYPRSIFHWVANRRLAALSTDDPDATPEPVDQPSTPRTP